MQQLSAGQNSSTPSVSLFLSVIALNSIKIKCFWIPKTQSDFEYEDFNQLKVNKYLGHKHIARFRWLRKTHTQPVHVSPLHVLHAPTRLPLHGKISEPVAVVLINTYMVESFRSYGRDCAWRFGSLQAYVRSWRWIVVLDS